MIKSLRLIESEKKSGKKLAAERGELRSSISLAATEGSVARNADDMCGLEAEQVQGQCDELEPWSVWAGTSKTRD